MTSSLYTPAEGKARDEIDEKLAAAGWAVQTRPKMNLYQGLGQAVRDFTLKDGHGRFDYLLFVEFAQIATSRDRNSSQAS
jgi:type I restriction enzyme R subunit